MCMIKTDIRSYTLQILLWISCLGAVSVSYGQIKDGYQLQGNVTHLSTQNGLSHDGVLCITRDRDGFLWFGTWDGINRFDGHNFVVYKSRPGDHSSLKNNKIRSIDEDFAGFLWVQTYNNKVYRFDKKTETFLAISDGPYHYLFDNLTIDKIVPDVKGGVWLLTTTQGVIYVRENADGVPVVHPYSVSQQGSSKLYGNKINFLFKDQLQRTWIGTDKGLNRLAFNKTGTYAVQQGQKNSGIANYEFTAAAQNQQKLFFGTSDGRLITVSLKTNAIELTSIAEGHRINAICSSRSGLIYITTAGKGLAIYNPLTGKTSFAEHAPAQVYHKIYEDPAGRIWIEPDRTGIVKYDPGSRKFRYYTQKKDIPSQSRDYQVTTDANGIIWTSMKGGGFGYYDTNKDEISYFYDHPGQPDQKFSNTLNSLLIDQTGVLWIAGMDGGINKVYTLINKFNHTRLSTKENFPAGNTVRAMLKDHKGRLWLGSKDGYIRVLQNGKEVTVFDQGKDKIGNAYALMEDVNHNVWIGTKGNGLYQATPVNAQRTRYSLKNYTTDANNPSGLSSNLIYALLEDRKGRIWVGTLGGGINLVVADGNTVKFKNHNNSFKYYPFVSDNVIRHLAEDRDGKIWVATNNGLLLFNPDKGEPNHYRFTSYRKVPGDKTSLGNNSVQYIHRDRNDGMWLGTFGGGLNQAIPDPKAPGGMKFKSYTTANGLANDIILSITSDRFNKLWMSTERGLSRFDPKQGIFKNYDTNDGLPKGRFSEAASLSDNSSELLFGCSDGYLSFDPAKITAVKTKAKMVLTKIQLYYKDISPGTEGSPLKYAINETHTLRLDHDQNVISIDYAVLDYRAVNKINYAYKLEGFDENWHQVNEQRKATYTNLPPGHYTFHVKATNRDFFTDTPEKQLHIVISPPFYLTTLAYILYLILAAGLFYFARKLILTMINLRNKIIIEQKLTEAKLDFFTNISHELRTPLTLIVSPLEELTASEELTAAGKNHLYMVNRNVNRMTRIINQLLDFRKLQSGKMQLRIREVELFNLVKDVSEHFKGVITAKEINFKITSPADQLYVWADAEKLDIILYNLLSNAFKFTDPHKSIEVSLAYESDGKFIIIQVRDQGMGIPDAQTEQIFDSYYEGNHPKQANLKGTGIGLALSRALAEIHHATLTAKNNPDEGATFTLRLLTGKAHYTTQQLQTEFIAQVNSELPHMDDQHNGLLPFSSKQDPQVPLVLVVEDNAELRKFLARHLAGWFRIIEADNGVQGLELTKSLLPDLIISDVMMPEMDGIQLLDKLKNDLQTSHIPIILLTAKSSVESQIEALRYGADLYIVKPFHLNYVRAAITNLITSRKKLFEQLAENNGQKVFSLAPGEVMITAKDEIFLKEVITIVESGMQDPEFNIDHVAASIAMGRTTFFKKLKSLTGLSPVEFVREMRLKRSKQLMDAGMDSVSEIAYLAGFNSLPYFSTCFKARFGISPSSYLKNMRSAASES
jgi:signal transduction histidine kinase/ligand-binding sensor domain-containing protein/CheY-like chemotaxis protein